MQLTSFPKQSRPTKEQSKDKK